MSTLFFILQHYFSLSWDFAAYVLNTKYLFYHGTYFEFYRAPLISIILFPLLIFDKMGEYLYIILISTLFLYSVKKLSDTLYERYFIHYKVDKKFLLAIFYFFSLNLFLLLNGLNVGTELLALSFFQLFLSRFLKNELSGHYLALATLSRYNFLIFVILFFFSKDVKKIIKNLGLFILILSPWLIFNWIKYGNFLQSIIDSYYLNIISRQGLIETMHLSQFLQVANLFTPFALAGIFFIILFKHKNRIFTGFIFLITLFLFFDFYNTPFKITRYLFNFCLPVAFFSTVGFLVILRRYSGLFKLKYLPIIFFMTSILVLSSSYVFIGVQDKLFFDASEKISELNLSNCYFLSPHWTPLNYYNENVYFLSTDIPYAISKNNLVILFPNNPTYDDVFTEIGVNNSNTLFENERFIIFGKKGISSENCTKWTGYDFPLVSNPCEVISQKFSFLSKQIYSACRLVNLH